MIGGKTILKKISHFFIVVIVPYKDFTKVG